MPALIRLELIPPQDLPELARGLVPARLGDKVLVDGLPPPHVAMRTQTHLAAGKPPCWVSTYYVISEDGWIVGGAGFKDAPHQREAEIGYGIGEARRGLGYASAAVQELVRIATASGEVDTLIAHIAPDNPASMRVATRAGFRPGEAISEGGHQEVRWRRQLRRG